jgi:hypothetical protein
MENKKKGETGEEVEEMRKCYYDVEKHMMITFAIVAISLIVGHVLFVAKLYKDLAWLFHM